MAHEVIISTEPEAITSTEHETTIIQLLQEAPITPIQTVLPDQTVIQLLPHREM